MSFGIDAHEELERMVTHGFFWGGGYGIRPQSLGAVRADENRLAGEIRKWRAAEIDDDCPRPWRGGAHSTDRSRQQHGALC